MRFHEKLTEFFEARKISNKEVAKRINYSEVMISRYLKSSKPNYELISALINEFPEIDLNYLFKENDISKLEEESTIYSKNELILIDEIELRLHTLKEKLAQK